MSTNQPVIITIGNGIGPEITAQWLSRRTDVDQPLWIVGNVPALLAFKPTLHANIHLHPVSGSDGQIAYQSLVLAVEAIAQGKASGLVTGPISKAALWAAGYTQYTGHTEILADLAKQYWPGFKGQAQMLFAYQRFRLLLLTRHIPLAQVTTALNRPDIEQALSTLVLFLQTTVGITRPTLAMLGVNPHAGEIGGHEEKTLLVPASQSVMDTLNCQISAPMAADGFFRGFDPVNPLVDCVVAPYHDQGLIPFKLLAGWQAVNVTIGLPFLRTSVSHGTAPDLVGKNQARPDSLVAAYNCLLSWLQ